MHACIIRCMSVAYSPIGRECRISRFDQRDSRILYDPDFDYYENLVGKRQTDELTDVYFDHAIHPYYSAYRAP